MVLWRDEDEHTFTSPLVGAFNGSFTTNLPWSCAHPPTFNLLSPLDEELESKDASITRREEEVIEKDPKHQEDERDLEQN